MFTDADPFDNIFFEVKPAFLLLFFVSGVIGLVLIAVRPPSSLLVCVISFLWGMCFAAFTAYFLIGLCTVVYGPI
jgi:hypothetical protein